MNGEVTLRRIEIIEARVSDLERRLNAVNAPILDALESFRRDTLSMFESTKADILGSVKQEIAGSEKRLAAMIAELAAKN